MHTCRVRDMADCGLVAQRLESVECRRRVSHHRKVNDEKDLTRHSARFHTVKDSHLRFLLIVTAVHLDTLFNTAGFLHIFYLYPILCGTSFTRSTGTLGTVSQDRFVPTLRLLLWITYHKPYAF